MKKRLLALPVVLLILAVTAFGAFANDEKPTATVVISGGDLSVDTPDTIPFAGLTLGGTDTTVNSGSDVNTWTVTDARGTGAGWSLTISSTEFVKDGDDGKKIDIVTGDQLFKIQLMDATIAYDHGNDPPESDVETLTQIPVTEAAEGPLTILTAAAGDGMGTYTFTPNFTLGIPAETYAGTYNATVTVSTVSGP